MSLTSANVQSAEIRALECEISALENQYAELFLEDGSPQLLKNIHNRLEVLKRELKGLER